MRAFVALNPFAGKSKSPRTIKRFENLLIREGFKPQMFISEEKDHIRNTLAQLDGGFRKDFDIIISVGGDGTLSEVISGLAKAGEFRIPIGVIPFGTGNDLARTLNIPLNFPAFAVRVIKMGKLTPLDISRINDHYFINYVGFGFDGHVISFKTFQKTLLPKKLSYFKPILQALKELKTYKYNLKIDGKESTIEGINLIITNIPTYSAGIRLYPEAKLDDKVFEITFLRKIPKTGNLMLMPIMHSKILRMDKDFQQFQAQELEVKFPGDFPPIQVDGDLYPVKNGKFKINIIPEHVNIYSNI